MTQPKIIAALAHACHCEGFPGLEWSRCPGLYPRDYLDDDSVWPCVFARGHAGVCCDVEGFPGDPDQVKPLPPTLAEWQAEWAASHPGEPGRSMTLAPLPGVPGPEDKWASADVRVSWLVRGDGIVSIKVGAVEALRHVEESGWGLILGLSPVEVGDLALLARLMAAVDGAR